jgi:tetratricopeptide (TPR) repeat protein
LIQLTQIPTYLRQFTEFIEPVLSGQQVNTGIIGIPILIFCLFDGFLIGYLWTRCYAPTEFGKKRSELQKFTNDIKIYKQDYEAITLAKRILDQETELPIQEEFNQKIKKASDNAKDYIFYLAEKERKSSRESSIEDPENKISHLLKMELTIPVFRALVTSNPENYRAHAQLGFALKDKKNPAWKEALDELNKAITKFPENDKYNYKYRLYKINRAVCNINLDPDYQIDIETKDRKRLESILEDILYCVDSEYIQKNFINDGNKPFQKWMAINKYSINNLNTCIQQYNYQNNEIPTN